MTIAQFAEMLNKYAPSGDQIKESRFRFTYDIPEESKEAEEKLYQLIERTNIADICPGGINFYNEVQPSLRVDNGLDFASYNDYEIFCFKRTNSFIEWYDREQPGVEMIASNLDLFLSFLVECRKYDMHNKFGVEYDKDDSRGQLDMLIKNGFSKRIVKQLMG